MLRLTRAVVAARPGHAFALFLLGLLAIGAAVAAPAFARAAQVSVAGSDVGATPLTGRTVAVNRTVVLRPSDPNDPNSVPDNDPTLVQRVMPGALHINGFQGVYEASFATAGGRGADDYTNRQDGTVTINTALAFRSDACAHIVLLAGRCVAAPME